MHICIHLKVIGNRLAQVHFYKKEDALQTSSGEAMETLVNKISTTERNINENTTSLHTQNPSINALAPTAPVTVSQPTSISKTAKPVRDTAQFVS